MDAHAHLISLGWAGPGHALDSRPYKQKGHRGLAYDPSKVANNGTGLVKPLLISQRKARFGVGKKTHEPPAGNEWWLKGFESALGNIGKSESERSSGTSTPVAGVSKGGKHGGLYTFFIKGQQMQGTMGDLDEDLTTQGSKKRKSSALDDDDDNEDDSTTSSQQKSKSRVKTAAEFEQVGAYLAVRDKDEKRRHRGERPSPVEEFRQVGAYLEARSEKKEKKSRKRKSEAAFEVSGASTEVDADATEEQGEDGETNEGERTETKEERRERRRLRREQKERRRAERAEGEETVAVSLGLKRSEPSTADVSAEEDAEAEAARRAERKRRRKAEKAAAVPSKG